MQQKRKIVVRVREIAWQRVLTKADDHEERSSIFRFSFTSVSKSRSREGGLDRDASLIFVRHSWTHVHLGWRSSPDGGGDCEIIAWRWERPRIGAREMTERKTSFKTISGLVSKSDTV